MAGAQAALQAVSGNLAQPSGSQLKNRALALQLRQTRNCTACRHTKSWRCNPPQSLDWWADRTAACSPGRQFRPADHRWRQPPAQSALRLDQAALAAALEAGPAEAEGQRVYVSRATLVVVPPTLVGHWTHQIAAHTAPGARCVRRLIPMSVCLLTPLHHEGTWAACKPCVP